MTAKNRTHLKLPALLKTQFKSNLRAAVEQSCLLPNDLAVEIGISRILLQQLCSGRRPPTLPTLVKLCTYFKCSLDSLLGFNHGETDESN